MPINAYLIPQSAVGAQSLRLRKQFTGSQLAVLAAHESLQCSECESTRVGLQGGPENTHGRAEGAVLLLKFCQSQPESGHLRGERGFSYLVGKFVRIFPEQTAMGRQWGGKVGVTHLWDGAQSFLKHRSSLGGSRGAEHISTQMHTDITTCRHGVLKLTETV